MVDRVYLYNQDKYVGILTHDTVMNTYLFKQEEFGDLEDRTVEYLSLNSRSQAIEVAIQERVAPRDRININELLPLVGLDHYDMWEIFKRINGICYKDTVWVSESKEDPSWFFENHAIGRFMKTGKYN